MGAPESTAAGVFKPGSLPSITRIGTGEKALQIVLVFAAALGLLILRTMSGSPLGHCNLGCA